MRDAIKIAGQRRAREPARVPDVHIDEATLIIEALRLAACEITRTADSLERLWPTSPLVERFRIFAERMNDIRQRREHS